MEDDLAEILKSEIIRELLISEDPKISDDEITMISALCKTPWDAVPMLLISRLADDPSCPV